MKLLFDIETDALDPTVCHSLVIIDVDTGVMTSYADQDLYHPISEGLEVLGKADLLVGHNILDYDLVCLEKLYDFKYKGKLHDTLIMSRLLWPDIRENDFRFIRKPKGKNFPKSLIGSHSLKSWGHRLGNYKGDFEYSVERFANWSQPMQDYCEQDCKLNLDLYKLILSKEPTEDSIELEHDFARCIKLQEQQGFNFDVIAAENLLAKLQARSAELEAELQIAFPPFERREPFIPKVNNKTRGYVKGKLTYKSKMVVFNPGSRDQIADRLQAIHGWKPTEFTNGSGKPKIDETVLSKLPYKEAKLVSEYLLIGKRIGMLATGANAWLKLVNNGKIHGRMNTIGCVSHRCSHSKPNMGQIPRVGSPYGEECRSLFHAPEGYDLVGADLAGLELRCLAHMMARYDGGAYANEVINGDVHTLNQKAAGLPSRDASKSFIYGFLYGMGPEKCGSMIGGSAQDGRKMINKFLKRTPALKELRKAVDEKVKRVGTLNGLDGRKLPIRHSHTGLNTLLQSAGAILAKRATVILHNLLESEGYVHGEDWAQVAHVHDEVQLIAKKKVSAYVGKQAVKAFQLSGEYYNFRCQITGDYKTGNNWKDTH